MQIQSFRGSGGGSLRRLGLVESAGGPEGLDGARIEGLGQDVEIGLRHARQLNDDVRSRKQPISDGLADGLARGALEGVAENGKLGYLPWDNRAGPRRARPVGPAKDPQGHATLRGVGPWEKTGSNSERPRRLSKAGRRRDATGQREGRGAGVGSPWGITCHGLSSRGPGAKSGADGGGLKRRWRWGDPWVAGPPLRGSWGV